MSDPLHSEVAILNAALELSVEQRAAYLDEACAGNTALRRQVEALLQSHGQAEDFLDTPPSGLDFKRTMLVNTPPTEKPGDKIDRYKLLQQIGEGGCGVVYMAEQEEPVRRRVALKVIKLGMDTKSVIARFEVERQALALMDHPNIAKIFDAGITGAPVEAGASPAVEPGFQPGGASVDSSIRGESSSASPGGRMPPSTAGGTPAATLSAGRPYFVMELVRGVKITDFCDENNVSTAGRLKLFIQVCQAIQHAHQKGIIHRDIKPSNILVTVNDGVPVPKVIDFGIAKATQGRLTDHTLFTAFEQFIGTPAYMSPEQAVMTSLDIDTRSDIYSLGVLLYELLTGRTPFDQKELLAAGLDEMRRTIREKEPPKPSTRLTQDLVAADVRRLHSKPEIQDPKSEEEIRASSRRLLQMKELIHLLRGDLDWVVMKCLEKDRSRRYETANGVAADLQRHLNDEPVNACPPSGLYRLQKAIRRNKGAFAATAAIAIVLVIGVVVSTLEAIRATRAEREQIQLRQRAVANEKKARTEAAKSQQVARFLKEMLQGVSPWVASGRDTTVLREILDKAAGRLSGDLSNQPEVELELRNTIGWVYRELGDGVKAEAVLRDAPAIARKLWGSDDLRLAELLQNLALAFVGPNGKPKEAEALQREVLAIRRKALGNESPAVGQSLRDLANVLRIQGRLAEAEKTAREALAIQSKLWPQGDPEVAASLFDLEIVLRQAGRWPEAETAGREALAMYLKLSGEENPGVANALRELGYVLLRQGKLAEAEPLLRKALAMQTKLIGRENPEAAWTLISIAMVLSQEDKLVEAEQAEREALAIQRKLYASGDRNVVETLKSLVRILEKQGKLAEAKALLEGQTNTPTEKKSEAH